MSDYIKREDVLQAIAGLLNVTEQIDSVDVIEVGKQYPATEFNVEEELKDGKLYFAIVRNEGGNDETD